MAVIFCHQLFGPCSPLLDDYGSLWLAAAHAAQDATEDRKDKNAAYNNPENRFSVVFMFAFRNKDIVGISFTFEMSVSSTRLDIQWVAFFAVHFSISVAISTLWHTCGTAIQKPSSSFTGWEGLQVLFLAAFGIWSSCVLCAPKGVAPLEGVGDQA